MRKTVFFLAIGIVLTIGIYLLLPTLSHIKGQLLHSNLEVDGRINLSCITVESAQAAIKLREIQPLVQKCTREIRESIPEDLTDGEIELIVAMVAVHLYAPYGPSVKIEFEELVNEQELDCDNYASLLGHLLQNEKFRFVGFDGGAVGNHAQVYYEGSGLVRPMLLDPTASTVAFISFDELLSGHPTDKVYIFNQRADPKLGFFYKKVYSSLRNGLYRPSDLLYFYFNLDHLMGKFKYPYITPAGYYLCRQSGGPCAMVKN